MEARRALLIGAEQYGRGFDSLLAAPRDVALLNELLARCGHQVEVCDDRLAGSASALDKRIRDF